MHDLTPRIDRPALERIIQRAAELQAREREIGEGLTEDELMKLGEEVGIPTPYLRQALLEERTQHAVEAERGLVVWLAGPRYVAAQRTVPGTRREIEGALSRWMSEGELLQVKRRFPEQTSWEPQRGTIASLKRSFELGGRQYVLARAKEVAGQVVQLDASRCHVRLVADLSNSYGEHLWGAGLIAGGGAAATATLITLGFAELAAALPVLGATAVAGLVARSRMNKVDRMHVALEQVLDRLEHGEIPATPAFQGPRPSAFVRMADEIKRSLGL